MDTFQTVYLFISILDIRHLKYIIEELETLKIIENKKLIFVDCISFFGIPDIYIGIYNNNICWFNHKIENKNIKYDQSNLEFTKNNLRNFKIGDFVKRIDSKDNKIYIIYKYDVQSRTFLLFDLSRPYNEEEEQKKNKFSMLPYISYRNLTELYISDEKPLQPIPKYVKNFISSENNNKEFFNAKNIYNNNNNNNKEFFNAKNIYNNNNNNNNNNNEFFNAINRNNNNNNNEFFNAISN